jgi:hypothetical protein
MICLAIIKEKYSFSAKPITKDSLFEVIECFIKIIAKRFKLKRLAKLFDYAFVKIQLK